MARRLHIAMLIIVAASFAAFYWLMRDSRPGDAPAKPIAMAELRALAGSMPGNAPSRIDAELVGTRQVAGDIVAAGSGLRQAVIGSMAYRLAVPGAGPIVIDSGIRAHPAAALGISNYLAPGQRRVEAALRRAGVVVLTSERAEHSGGLRAVLREGMGHARVVINARQKRRLERLGAKAPPATIFGTAPQAVAPGVVVVPTPGISTGSQMVFVRLADGREFLFTGDAAMLDVSWRELRAQGRIAGWRGGVPDRREAYAWLRTIRALKRQAPDMLVVPGHDITYLRNAQQKRPRLNLSFPSAQPVFRP
jgi:glyoxylase-like metal-dependent hydrolase (beta-lactamase superfamily II)